MHSESLKDLLHAAPFVPFRIALTDGRRFTLDHPDFATLMKNGRTLFLNTEGSRFTLIDTELITSVESQTAAAIESATPGK